MSVPKLTPDFVFGFLYESLLVVSPHPEADTLIKEIDEIKLRYIDHPDPESVDRDVYRLGARCARLMAQIHRGSH